ncbi:MAG: triose-phosphate isomerase [Gammaproteobacteria bacterium]|nr:triose-phosphate isomerase [Gammaproteobacteria bacterium]
MTGTTKKNWVGTSWKMNKVRREAEAFSVELSHSSGASSERVQRFVIPPYPYIHTVADLLSNTDVKIGAQNMHWEEQGAWTGEVSAPMVIDCGATMVEIGHSERRSFFNESDETVSLKVQAAAKHGLLALVCIGDTKEEYDAGLTKSVLERQVRAALSKVQPGSRDNVMFAYEPVWSIGDGGVPADPDFANTQHEHIKEITDSEVGEPLAVLYGGSVNLQNCCQFSSQPHIDGLFIGRAAWEAKNYIAIVDAVSSLTDDL